MPSEAILTVDQMRAAEQAAMDSAASEWELMQRAGQGAGQWVARMAAGRAVCVLCGPGNNGGDGYVIAEFLRAQGNPVHVIAPKPPGSQTARTAREAFGGKVLEEGELDAPVIVDCLFGYGLSREVKGAFAVLLKELDSADAFKIAVDVPSSIASDTGEAMGPVVHYDLTLALGAWKHAHLMMPAMAAMGTKRLIDIDLSPTRDAPSLSQAPRLSAPAADAHKYRRGLLAVIAGEMPGAPILAAEAAMRCGAGYVKLFSDHSHPDAPVDLVIEDGPLDEGLADDRIAAVLIGPGLGRSDASRQRLEQALATRHPAILDADALHLLTPTLLEGAATQQLVVTPHEGELAALCKAFDVGGNTKLDRAKGLHEATGMTVLAKGPDTVLVGKHGVRFFPRGSSWLSVAGSGDVLAGMAASRLAYGGDGYAACEEAIWIHHEAARLSKPAFTASELADKAAEALETFL